MLQAGHTISNNHKLFINILSYTSMQKHYDMYLMNHNNDVYLNLKSHAKITTKLITQLIDDIYCKKILNI